MFVGLSGKLRQEVWDRDVGEHAVRGAGVRGYGPGDVSRLLRQPSAEEARRADVVQLLGQLLGVRPAAEPPQSAPASRPDTRHQLEDCQAPVRRRQHQWQSISVEWLQSPEHRRELLNWRFIVGL